MCIRDRDRGLQGGQTGRRRGQACGRIGRPRRDEDGIKAGSVCRPQRRFPSLRQRAIRRPGEGSGHGDPSLGQETAPADQVVQERGRLGGRVGRQCGRGERAEVGVGIRQREDRMTGRRRAQSLLEPRSDGVLSLIHI